MRNVFSIPRASITSGARDASAGSGSAAAISSSTGVRLGMRLRPGFVGSSRAGYRSPVLGSAGGRGARRLVVELRAPVITLYLTGRVPAVESRQGQGTPLLAGAPVRSPAIADRVTARPGVGATLAVAAVTLAGAALRVATAHQSLFADELSTYWIVSTRGLRGVLSTVHSNAEITPPLSFVLGWLATRIDLTPEMLRLPSLVAGIATIPILYRLGVRTVGRAAGAVGASLTALAPFMIYYSAEARGYALVMAFVALATLTMLIAVDSGRARWWVAYAASSGTAIYTHYTCVFVLGVGLLWLLWAHPEARRPALLANLT